MRNIFIFIVLNISLLLAVPPPINISTTRVGPGVVHKKFLEVHEPWVINVIEIDLTHPDIWVESLKAGDKMGVSLPVSQQLIDVASMDKKAVAGINADFFGSTQTLNSQVVNGEIVKKEYIDPANPTYWPTFGLSRDNKPSIEYNIYQGLVFSKDQDKTSIQNINNSRNANELILYNRFNGVSTGTNEYGYEVSILPFNSWLVNDTILCKILEKESYTGSMLIPSGGAVLSAHGDKIPFLSSLNSGDTIKVYLGLQGSVEQLTQLIGGFPTMIKNGRNTVVQSYVEEGGTTTFHTDSHPRSAIGFSGDSTKVYLVTVDGRQAISRGMNLVEMADFMLGLGVWKAMNLDGGGSTAIIVNDRVENSPSDGQERNVHNALGCFSLAPVQDSIAHVQVIPDNYRLFYGRAVNIELKKFDKYYNHLGSIPTENIVFNVDSALGTVDATGRFQAGAIAKDGWIISNYDGMQDSLYVYLKNIVAFNISPAIASTDTIKTIQFKVNILDEDGLSQQIRAHDMQWSVLDPEIGAIDSMGVFTAKDVGTTQIIVQFEAFRDTSELTVFVHEGSLQLDNFNNTANWNLDGELMDLSNSGLSTNTEYFTTDSASLQLDYKFIRLVSGFPYAWLNTDIMISGIPESFSFDFLSDGYRHKLYMILEDAEGDNFMASMIGYATDTTNFINYKFPLSEFYGSTIYEPKFYPVTIKSIWIKLGNSTDIGLPNQGTVLIDNLNVNYTLTGLEENSNREIPSKFQIVNVYPNPFNSQCFIQFMNPVKQNIRADIYNIRGEKVATLIHSTMEKGLQRIEINERKAGLSGSGIYFIKLRTEQGSRSTRKIIYLK